MSNKTISLGSLAAVANGLTISGATNATPIVVTLGAGHGLNDDDRIAVTGITGNTGANGEWKLGTVTATTAVLLGSVGNGAYAGTPVVANLCDVTPHAKGHTALALLNFSGTGVTVAPIMTVFVEGSSDNVTFATALASGSVAIPAITTSQSLGVEIVLQKYMRLRASAWTSGTCNAQVVA